LFFQDLWMYNFVSKSRNCKVLFPKRENIFLSSPALRKALFNVDDSVHSRCLSATAGRHRKRERDRWLTGSEACGLQEDQGSSRGAIPGRRQCTSRHPGAATSPLTCQTRTTCPIRIRTKDDRYVETRLTGPISIVLPSTHAPVLKSYYTKKLQYMYLWHQSEVRFLSFVIVHNPTCLKQLSRLIYTYTYREIVSKMWCMNTLFVCSCLSPLATYEGPAVVWQATATNTRTLQSEWHSQLIKLPFITVPE